MLGQGVDTPPGRGTHPPQPRPFTLILSAALRCAAGRLAIMGLLCYVGPGAAAEVGGAEHPPLTAGLAALPAKKAGAPRESDVILSIRVMGRSERGLRVAEAFGATRIEWIYSDGDRGFAQAVHRLGARVGGTINANTTTPDAAGAARDFDGKAVVAPWMKTWGAQRVTTTSPRTRQALFATADRYLDAGYDSLQVDGAGFQADTLLWTVGDFSDTTLAGFARYLDERVSPAERKTLAIPEGVSFDFRAYLRTHGVNSAAELLQRRRSLAIMPLWSHYLRDTVTAFYADLRRHLDRRARATGRHIALSMNMGPADPRIDSLFPIAYADYLLNEVPLESLGRMALRVGIARAFGVGFAASVIPAGVAETREALVGYYALGAQPLVPWDVFTGADATHVKPRYFGRVEDYGDIFHFVRRHQALFDAWVVPPVVGLIIDLENRHELAATMAAAEQLLTARVPFCVFPLGGNLPPVLRPARISGLRALVAADPAKVSSAANQIPGSTQLLGFTDLTAERLRTLAPLTFPDPSARAVVPHVRNSARADGMVVHFVGPSPPASAPTPLSLRRQDVCGMSAARARLLGVDGTSARVAVHTQGDSIIFAVPPRSSAYSLLDIVCGADARK